MTRAARIHRWRAFGAGGSALALAAGLLVAIGLTAGAPHAAANPTGSSPAVYVTGSGGVSTLGLASARGGGASASAVSGIPAGLFVSGPMAINATATEAVVGLETQTFVAANTYWLGVINVSTRSVTGVVQLLDPPVGFAMDPTNHSTAYVVESNADEGGEIQRANIGVSPPTLTTVPSDLGRLLTPTCMVISPDGQTLYVGGGNSNFRGLQAISVNGGITLNNIVGRGPITDLAISPAGRQLFGVAPNAVFSLALPLTAAETPLLRGIKEPSSPRAVTVSPDGQTVYIGGSIGGIGVPSAVAAFTSANLVQEGGAVTVPMDTNGNAAGGLTGMAISPDQSTLVAYGLNTAPTGAAAVVLYPLSLPSLALGPGTTVAGFANTTGPEDIAITPDQAPVASFSATIGAAGHPTTFDASASTVAYGSVDNFAWNFGDGSTAVTAGPTVSHTYGSAGSYGASVTETDSANNGVPPAVAGTGFAVDSPGQTPYRLGRPFARTTRTIVVPAVPVITTTTTTIPSSHTTTTTTTTVPGKSTPGAPALVLNPAVGPPGTIVTVTGSGFKANTPVTLSWSVSTGSVVVTANAQGKLPPSLLYILTPDVLGPRFADASSTPPATAPFLVVPGDSEPGGDNASLLFRSEGP